ncbi:MAG TPA: SDR family oxidoreductase [Caulobacteraceae bacterium]|nr:SDR family oxidoreductase [Caulobacteraceae bacterium]
MTARLALVTGASAGIGAALARVYASHGYDLAITARRAERLSALAEEIGLRHGVRVFSLPADLSDPAAPARLIERIAAEGRVIDALVNNAGYGLAGAYAGQPWEAQRACLQVMLIAPAELTHRALPGMIERRFGRILQVASLAALVPGVGGAALYGAMKAFLVRLAQGLSQEGAGANVHVSAVCPGFTHSEFHEAIQGQGMDVADLPAWIWQGADEVAAAGYEAAEAGRPLAVPGAPNKAIAAFAKLLPDEWLMTVRARRARRSGLL